MGFGFLVPAFLAGLAVLAIPLFIHLRNRDRDTPFRFPSLMFLEQLPIRTSQRQRITDWPLLLLRALALALLVFAFARPVFTERALAGGDTRSRAVVLVIDRSLSMGYEGVFSRALDSARTVIRELGNSDRVGVVAFDDAAETLQRLTTDKAAATSVLASLTPRSRGTRMAPALRTARQMLLDAPFAAAEIIMISDLQRSGAAGIAGLDLPAGVTLRGIAVGSPSRANSAVRVVEARRLVEGNRSVLAVKARVLSHEGDSARSATATLMLNGREAATRSTTLSADGETVITFAPVPAPDGAVSGTVSLTSDALAADDTLHFVVPRDDALRVAFVLPPDVSANETLYLERALSIGQSPVIRVDRMRTAPTSTDELARTALVMFWDVAPTSAAASALAPWLEQGGGVVIAAGRRLATVRGDVPLLPATVNGLADRLADRGGTLRDVRYEHPLFAPFREATDALAAVRVLRYPRLEANVGPDMLARFDDGLPAVLEQRVGAGRTLVVAVPLDAQFGDFPVQPAYLPFVRQLVRHTAGRDAAPLWRTTGESWLLPTGVSNPVVQTPDGSLVRPTADSLGSAVALVNAGAYAVFAETATGIAVARVAANAPASESELTPIDTTELLLGVRETPRDASGNAAASGAPPTPIELERRQNPWRILLLLVALALTIETFLATRGARAIARRIRAVPADRVSPERSTR